MEEAKDFINLGIVLNKNNEVLIVRRVKTEEGSNGSKLTWVFPGGKQFKEETREAGVRNEVLAETGYDVTSLRQISLRAHPQFPVIIVYHQCQLNGERPVAQPKEPDEIAEVKWVKPEELKSYFTTDLDPKVAKFLGIGA